MLVVILLGIILAVMCYMFYTFRAEFFRISERQSNTLMHVARMNRGLLSSMQEMLTPAEAETEDKAPDGASVVEEVAVPSVVEEVAVPSVVEEVPGEELASAPVVAPVPGVLPVIEEVPRHQDVKNF